MKTLILLILSVFLSTPSFTQNRKELLKEINSYKNESLKNAEYITSSDSISSIVADYLKINEYTFDTKTDSGLVYYKRVRCAGEKQFPEKNKRRGTNRMYRNFYVTINLGEKDSAIIPIITSNLSADYPSKYEYNQAVLSGGTDAFMVNNDKMFCFYKSTLFSFNSMDLLKYIYINYYGNIIPFPEELQLKITNFNSQQKSEKEQLIAGRDY